MKIYSANNSPALDKYIGQDIWVHCCLDKLDDYCGWCRILEKLDNGEYKVNVVYDDEMGYIDDNNKFIRDKAQVTPDQYDEYTEEWTTYALKICRPVKTRTTDKLFQIVED
jgi:hypothetical protein